MPVDEVVTVQAGARSGNMRRKMAVEVLPVDWLMHRLKIMGLATPFGIFIRSDVTPERRVPLIRHELTHQDQMRRLGVRFYIQYLRQYAKYGYNKMPLEIEARQSEK